ncbi:hypothetical protein [Streptomyces xinghaiensis]|uniref:hypothetical protein n=1 Tax=Streptomyces xinghaiensis TaxID=1038928 RepID=UPI002E1008C2|nr:hypothetical protein OG463_22925 [Streptomyces xinghaiensis]
MSWTAAVVALSLVASWIWWRESGTAARWRFEAAMKTYCGGLLAHERSELYDGLWHETDLRLDQRYGPEAHRCMLGLTEVTVVRVTRDDLRTLNLDRVLLPLKGDRLPVPLPGGWRGVTNGHSIRVVSDCRGGDAAVAVTISPYFPSGHRERPEDGWFGMDEEWVRFATATVVKAADRWNCAVEKGTRVRELPAPAGPRGTGRAEGTCAGLPFARDKRFDTVTETPASALAVSERCEVHGRADYFDASYLLAAHFGPFAERARRNQEAYGEAGRSEYSMWATAHCPGDPARAHFSVSIPPEASVEYHMDRENEPREETFGLPALTEFAKRSADRHGCTDLRLPR